MLEQPYSPLIVQSRPEHEELKAFGLPYVSDLIARKTSGTEKSTLGSADLDFHTGEYYRLVGHLEQTAAESQLPDEPGARNDLHDLLVRLRLGGL